MSNFINSIKKWFEYRPIDRLIEFKKNPGWNGFVVPDISSIFGAIIGVMMIKFIL